MTTTLADNLRFLRALITRPKNIGAVLPSSPALAAPSPARSIPPAGPVLEIGPGTGVITEAHPGARHCARTADPAGI